MNELSVTEHAYERGKKRLRFKKNVVDKMALKAYNEGIRHSEACSNLHKYITKEWRKYKTANSIRIYGEIVYIFCGSTLVTLFKILNKLKKLVKVTNEK